MKCTPQKTMYSASGPGGRVPGQLEGVAGDVGELDDLVALVVVAEHEDLVPELLLGRAGALHQVRVGRRGQVAGALDAALAPRVGLTAEQQQGEGRRLDVERVWAVVTTRTLSVLRLDVWRCASSLFVELTLSIITASRQFDDGHSVDVTHSRTPTASPGPPGPSRGHVRA